MHPNQVCNLSQKLSWETLNKKWATVDEDGFRLPPKEQSAIPDGVDQNLLAKAFRQDLPALKNLNDANEKACVIFEAYVAIVHGRNYAPMLTA
ncbi:hypothetical protein TNCV_1387441 [Trichonephila clavipes]|nr:hypothetical protein TNCV_1387441 [Trichonephila clavipes]